MRARVEKWAPWVAGLVLVAGVASFAATRLVRGTPLPAAPATASAAGAKVPLAPEARAVAKAFVATAVARRNLVRAWQLAAPSLRGHLTLAQWRTGDIPVQPYPVAEATVAWAVKSSSTDSALLQLSFLPRKGSSAQGGDYTVGLTRIGDRWRVSSYTAATTIQPAPSGG